MEAKPKTWDQVLAEQAKRLRRDAQRRASGEKVLTHVPTGFTQLDQEYGGIRMGVMTELMAHTSDGKSAFMRQCVEAAAQSGAGVLWLIAEDPEDATAERQFSGSTGLATTNLGRLDVSAAELDRIDDAVAAGKSWAKRVLPVFEAQDWESALEVIDETGTIGGAPLQAVFVDYAQVLGSSKSLEDDIANFGKGVHERSRARGFAAMVSSQVSNDVIKRARDDFKRSHDIAWCRPSIGDTEWCKRLEKLSKAVWSLYRPGRWLREFGEEAEDNYAELHVIKANFGPMGWVRLNWDGPTNRFS